MPRNQVSERGAAARGHAAHDDRARALTNIHDLCGPRSTSKATNCYAATKPGPPQLSRGPRGRLLRGHMGGNFHQGSFPRVIVRDKQDQHVHAGRVLPEGGQRACASPESDDLRRTRKQARRGAGESTKVQQNTPHCSPAIVVDAIKV